MLIAYIGGGGLVGLGTLMCFVCYGRGNKKNKGKERGDEIISKRNSVEEGDPIKFTRRPSAEQPEGPQEPIELPPGLGFGAASITNADL